MFKIPSSIALIIVFWGFIYLPFLGRQELHGTEGKRILPAISMLDSGDWLTPELAGEEYYKKPPLINWLVAVAFKLADSRSELPARLISALAVLGFALFAVLMPSGWLDLRRRTFLSLVFLSFYGMITCGRFIEIEALLTMFTGISVLWWLNVYADGGGRRKLWFFPGIVLGLGLLLKGPVILLFFYTVVLCVLICDGKAKNLLSPAHLAAVILMLLIFFAWAYQAQTAKPPEITAAVSKTWKQELLDQFIGMDIRFDRWIGAVAGAFAIFLPWLPLMPLAWNRQWISEVPAEKLNLFKGLRLAVVICFILINLMPGTETRYTMPVLSIAAILAAYTICLREDQKIFYAWRISVLVLAGAAAALLTAGFVLFYFLNADAMIGMIKLKEAAVHPFRGIPMAGALILLAAGLAASFAAFKFRKALESTDGLCLATAGVVLALMMGFILYFIPLENCFDKKRFAGAEITAAVPQGKALVLLDVGYQPFTFYIGAPHKFVYSFSSLGSSDEYLLMGDNTYEDFKESLEKRPEITGGRKPETVKDVKYKRNIYWIVRLK